MQYTITDNGASISLQKDDPVRREISFMKHSVKRIGIVREDILKIDTGNPFTDIFFRHRHVVEPITSDALELKQLINIMITDCVCCDCTSD